MEKKTLQVLRCARVAHKSLIASLKIQESQNKKFREKITAIWGDKSQDENVQYFGTQLYIGKCRVRAYQNALKALKKNIKSYNRAYELLSNAVSTAPVESM